MALKVLDPELALAVRTERFEREIAIAAQLNHPHIVPLFEAGVAGEFRYYTMPYVAGESLRDRLARTGPFPIDEAVRTAREVAGALAYAHGRGVVHRDIKPGNILIDAGLARVADFGIARAIDRDTGDTVTQTGTPLGTPAYMSPEQCSADHPVDERTDVYGLGCVLHEMLVGRAPFQGSSFESILAQKLVEPMPLVSTGRPDVPAWLEDVVATALARDPADRYKTADEFSAALEGRHARPRIGRPWHALRLPQRSIIAVAAGAVVLAGAFWAWRERRPAAPGGATALDPRRIAVLYFDDLSSDRRLGHVAAGFTQDLIGALSQVRALRVISPEGVRAFRGSSTLLDSIARTLGVGTIVSGSVAESQGRLRVSVRMVDPATGVQLLSQTVERPAGDLFEVEDQITSEVASGLRERLGSVVQIRERRAGTHNVAAWDLLQRADRLTEDARTINLKGDARSALRVYGKADSLFHLAETLDPRWTSPRVGRGWVAYAIGLVSPSRSSAPLERWFRSGIAHANAALAVQENDPEALQLRGILRYRLWNLSPSSAADSVLNAAERDLMIATAARPDLARSWHALASLYMDRARFEDAYTAAQRALDADAYLNEVRSVIATLFFAALHVGHEKEARSRCEEGLARFGTDPRFAECRLILLAWFGRGGRDVAEAWSVLAQIEREDSVGMLTPTWAYRRMLVSIVLARSHLEDSAFVVLARTRADTTRQQGPASLLGEAYALELLGRRGEALARIEEYARINPSGRIYAAATPWFRPLHDEPRFRTAVGLP